MCSVFLTTHTLHFPAQGKTDGNTGISQKTARRHVVAGNISPETRAERGKWDLTIAMHSRWSTHSLACSLLCGGVNKVVMLLSNSLSWYSSILEYKCESKHWGKRVGYVHLGLTALFTIRGDPDHIMSVTMWPKSVHLSNPQEMPVTIVTDNCYIPIHHFFYVLKICTNFMKKKYMHTFECVAEEYVSFMTQYHAIIA